MGFGLTKPLLRFWLRLGFVSVVLSPDINSQTGEVSLLVLKPLASASTALRQTMLSLGPEFRYRFLCQIQKTFSSVSTTLCVDLLAGSSQNEEGRRWFPSPSDLARLERLACTLDPSPLVAHTRDLYPSIAKAYFCRGLAPLKLERAYEDLLIALCKHLSPGEVMADLKLASANIAVHGAQHIARKVALWAGLCVGKEFMLSTKACASDESNKQIQIWLPPLHELHCNWGRPITFRGPPEVGEAQPCILPSFLVEWKFPVESDSAGDLFLNPLSGEDTQYIDLHCFHCWQRQEWSAKTWSSKKDFCVSNSQPCAHDVQIQLTFWDPAVSVLTHTQYWGRAYLPSLASLGPAPTFVELPVYSPSSVKVTAKVCGIVKLQASWENLRQFLNKNGVMVVQRGMGTLYLEGLQLHSTVKEDVPGVMRAEVSIFHLIDTVSGSTDAAIKMRVRPKQNRPKTSR